MSNITAVTRLRDAKRSMEKEQQTSGATQSKPAGKQLIALVGLLVLLCTGTGASASSQLNGGPERPVFPVPKGIPTMLFYLQRTPNSNTIVYDLNVDASGKLDEEEPVNIYWLRFTEGGDKKGLNWIQRKFAYGLKVKRLSPEKYELKSVAYDKRPMYLMKSDKGKYQIFTNINGSLAILNTIWIQIEGGTFWVPNVIYVEMKGIDPATGAEKMERFKP